MIQGNYKQYLSHKKQIGNYYKVNKIHLFLYCLTVVTLLLLFYNYIAKKNFKNNNGKRNNIVWVRRML